MTKKIIAILLCLAMLLSFAACDSKKQNNQGSEGTKHDPIKISIGYQATDEITANVVRDMLTKGGFEVEMKAFPDSAALKECQINGTTDIQFFSWGNVTGTPDYAVHAVWASDGDYNRNGYSNAEVDKLLVEATTLPLESNYDTYMKIEDIVVNQDCAWVAIYRGMQNLPHSPIMEHSNFFQNNSTAHLTYTDASQHDTRPFVRAQQQSSFRCFDPIAANDSSHGTMTGSTGIKLLTLSPDYQPQTDRSLSRNFATAEDCCNFYFILRDDCYFCCVDANKKVVEMDERVGGEDVVFTVSRIIDPKCVPVHAVYSMYTTVTGAEIVTDIAELESVKASTGKSIREELEAGITPISELASDKAKVDNAKGIYQVVKINTSSPFPQVLNNLCHTGAGVVDADWVAEINKDFNYDTYDSSKDVLYADSPKIREGSTWANDIHSSGPYILIEYNDYEAHLERNPGYYKSEPGKVAIKYWTQKFISDADANLSALRSGEIDYVATIPASKWDIAESDPNCIPWIASGTRIYCFMFNFHGNSECSTNVNLRKAIASCIDFEAVKAVYAGNALPARSFLSFCYPQADTTNAFLGHTQEYLDAYWAEKDAQ